jgi:hypothetical protein
MEGGFMLLQKNWWESRTILWTSLVTLICLAGMVMAFIAHDPWAKKLANSANMFNEETRQALPALSAFQGQVWVFWFKGVMRFFTPYLAICWAALVPGCAGPSTGKRFDGWRVFTLSLPISRRKILLTQIAMHCGGLCLVALASSALLPVISRWKGQWYSIKDAFIFASLSVIGALVFYFLTLLMTVIFDSGVKSLMFCLPVFVVASYPIRFVESYPRWNINRLIAGEDYFLYGRIPWLALIVSLLISASLLFGAVRIYERRDF